MPTKEQFKNVRIEIGRVFTPSTPISEKELFVGRIDLIGKLVDAVVEPGQHAVLYGLRGVGKTSLANVIHQWLTEQVFYTERVSCSRTDNFASLWRRMLSTFTYGQEKKAIGFLKEDLDEVHSIAEELPENDQGVTSALISSVLRSLRTPMLLIFDEFDTVADSETKAMFADLIKDLSDRAANTTVLLVGIGKTVVDIVGEHPSLERCLKQIKMPAMSDAEVGEIITSRLGRLGMTISSDIREETVALASGFPHFAHLITKYNAQNAVDRSSLKITRTDFQHGLGEAIENSNQTLKELYRKATTSSKRDAKFRQVLYACAIASEAAEDAFRTIDVVTAYNRTFASQRQITKQAFSYHLGKFSSPERGPVIEKLGSGKVITYRFLNPLFRAFVRLKTIADGDELTVVQ